MYYQFALDIATIPKTAAMAKLEDGSAAKVVPGYVDLLQSIDDSASGPPSDGERSYM